MNMEKVTQNTFKKYNPADDVSHLQWSRKSSKRLLDTPIFNVNSIVRESTDGRSGSFVEVVTPAWVNIVPVFTGTEGKTYFIMERQFRHGSATVTLEFPSGLVENGEKPEDAALRELWEETGIKAEKLIQTGKTNPNPAFMATTGWFFIAENLIFTKERKLDANEQIDIVCIEAEELLSILKKGFFDNAIVLASAFLYLAKRGKICL